MDERMSDSHRSVACKALIPCPFCGHALSEDDPFDVIYPVTRNNSVWNVSCSESNGGCDASVLCDGIHDAAERWNRRAHLATPAQMVDVEAIRQVIAALRSARKARVLPNWNYLERYSDYLERAIGEGEST